MLVRSWGILPLTLVCLLFAAAAPVQAADPGTKLERAKRVDRDGYVPTVLSRAAQVVEEEPNDTRETAQTVAVGVVVDADVPVSDVDWFRVDVSAQDFVTISTSARDASLTDTVIDVYALDGTTPLASDDDGGMALFSAVRSLAAPVDGTILVRVTRFGTLGDDAYALTVEPASAPAAPPSNDAAATAEVLDGCNAILIGSTVGATSTVGAIACAGPDQLGGDVFYRVEVPYSYQLTIQVEPSTSDFDPAAYLFTDPSDPAGSCVIGIDEAYAGEAETLIFTNESPEELPVQLYLAIDSWDPQRPGDYSAQVTCDFVVSGDETSFGAIKARF